MIINFKNNLQAERNKKLSAFLQFKKEKGRNRKKQKNIEIMLFQFRSNFKKEELLNKLGNYQSSYLYNKNIFNK